MKFCVQSDKSIPSPRHRQIGKNEPTRTITMHLWETLGTFLADFGICLGDSFGGFSKVSRTCLKGTNYSMKTNKTHYQNLLNKYTDLMRPYQFQSCACKRQVPKRLNMSRSQWKSCVLGCSPQTHLTSPRAEHKQLGMRRTIPSTDT